MVYLNHIAAVAEQFQTISLVMDSHVLFFNGYSSRVNRARAGGVAVVNVFLNKRHVGPAEKPIVYAIKFIQKKVLLRCRGKGYRQ